MSESITANDATVSIEQTVDVVAKILDDPDFANEVRAHNGWASISTTTGWQQLEARIAQLETALTFLACRYQSSVRVLSTQTQTLLNKVEALERGRN